MAKPKNQKAATSLAVIKITLNGHSATKPVAILARPIITSNALFRKRQVTNCQGRSVPYLHGAESSAG